MAVTWKPVPAYEGIYEASDTGKVRRVVGGRGTQAGRVLRPRVQQGTGYMAVNLTVGGQSETRLVHRIIAFAFLGAPPTPEHEVNHRNGNRRDNRLQNLEWVTRGDNHRHAYRTLGRKPVRNFGERNGQAKLTKEQVVQVRLRYALGGVTQKQIAAEFGVTQAAISMILTGRTRRTEN